MSDPVPLGEAMADTARERGWPVLHLQLFIPGVPRPQGSKRHVGRGILVEYKTLAPWRSALAAHATRAWGDGPLLVGPVHLGLEFVMPRPKATPKRSTPSAIKRPDLDKLQRAIFDALTHVVWADDAQITAVVATKRIAGLDEGPGLHLRVLTPGTPKETR